MRRLILLWLVALPGCRSVPAPSTKSPHAELAAPEPAHPIEQRLRELPVVLGAHGDVELVAPALEAGPRVVLGLDAPPPEFRVRLEGVGEMRASLEVVPNAERVGRARWLRFRPALGSWREDTDRWTERSDS